jgi:Mitochondrial carrier protein
MLAQYGWYEVFKPIAENWLTAGGLGDSQLLKFVIAGACAELIGSTFLSPFEATRIRMVANPSFATGLPDCLNKMTADEGVGSLFKGLPAILAKQLPYTGKVSVSWYPWGRLSSRPTIDSCALQLTSIPVVLHSGPTIHFRTSNLQHICSARSCRTVRGGGSV